MSLETTKGKWIYILYLFITTLILGYGWLGASLETQTILNFYLLWLFVPAAFVFIIDFVTRGKQMEEIDTVTWEDPKIKFFNPKTLIIGGIVISILIGWQIVSQGVGLVGVPEFNIFDNPFGNAILSGLIGIYENLAFFGVIYPTIRAIIKKHFNSMIMAVVLSSLITAGVFMGYHWWRYGMNEVALYYVLFFAIINVAFVQVTNSLVWSDMLHFTNNAVVTLGYASQIVVMLVL